MTTPEMNTQMLMRLEEQLRQEREVFDQRKAQGERWFTLRLRMGYMAVVLLPLFMGITSYIIFNSGRFPPSVVALSATALLADVLGTLLSVWKLVLSPDSISKAEPVTNSFDKITADGSHRHIPAVQGTLRDKAAQRP
jgi:hypothetical protein